MERIHKALSELGWSLAVVWLVVIGLGMAKFPTDDDSQYAPATPDPRAASKGRVWATPIAGSAYPTDAAPLSFLG